MKSICHPDREAKALSLCVPCYLAKRRKENPELYKGYQRKGNSKAKIEAMTHYGAGGKLQCCWPGCEIADVDMLALDHVKDDGTVDRLQHGRKDYGGNSWYRKLRLNNFPVGLQTLCMNHQFKKEILRRQKSRK